MSSKPHAKGFIGMIQNLNNVAGKAFSGVEHSVIALARDGALGIVGGIPR